MEARGDYIKGWNAGHKAGIKEVVRWLGKPYFVQELRGEEEPQCWRVGDKYIRQVAAERGEEAYYLLEKHIPYQDWQTKLKEWGIE